MRVNNYVGYKIGMLEVLEKTTKKNKQGRILYKCQCECGNIVYHTASELRNRKSCGCLRHTRFEDLTGRKFDMLYVIEKTNKKNNKGRVLYKCKCECGNIVYYTSSDIKQNRSCGCWRKSRARINEMLETMKYIDNTSIALISKTTLNSNNTSGFRGVSYDKSRNKWRAYIKLQYKTINLGRFNTFEKAVQARLEAEEKYYKPIIEKHNKKEVVDEKKI